MKMLRIVEVAWLFVAAICIYELATKWTENGNMSFVYLGFLGVAIFMYFLRRRTRLNYQDKNNTNP